MSTPISATSTRATVSLTPGIVVSRSAASRKGRSTSSACRSSFCTAARNASICPRCSSSRKRWCAVTRPCTAATMSARLAFTRTLVQSANRSGSVSPAMSAARIARPLTPRMSVTTRVSFTFASSSVFCKRCVCRAISRTSCLRVRVRSRNSWIGAGGTKLPRISPCANRSAIQAASFRSLLRPGTFRMCCALASTSVLHGTVRWTVFETGRVVLDIGSAH